MQYAKVENGQFAFETSIQGTLKLAGGAVIANFNKLSEAEKITYGYYPLEDQTPVFDARFNTAVLPTYTVLAAKVTVAYAVVESPLETYKQQEIAKAYAAANSQLDQLVEGYSQLEVATWPAIQADVLAYGTSGLVGAHMQRAIDSSGYDAEGLEALLLPRIQQQATILARRKADAEAIMAALTHAEV